MYRAYVGNLDSRVTEESLHSLFEEHGLNPNSILLRRGYAFVECPDQTVLDKAIDELNGKFLYDMHFFLWHCHEKNVSKPQVKMSHWNGRHVRFSKWPARPRVHAGHHDFCNICLYSEVCLRLTRFRACSRNSIKSTWLINCKI